MSISILAIETSGSCCSVALAQCAGADPASHLALESTTLTSRMHRGVAEHSERLLAMADEVLAEAGIVPSRLDGIAFGQGPGGFTGLRVACGIAQGMGFALDRPLLPAPTPLILEQQLRGAEAGWRLIVQDARMQEVYASVVHRAPGAALANLRVGPALLPHADVSRWWQHVIAQLAEGATDPQRWWFVGDGEQELPAAVVCPPGMRVWPEPVGPHAAALAELALARWGTRDWVPADQASPLYVRDKVAFTTVERAAGAGGNPRAGLVPGPA